MMSGNNQILPQQQQLSAPVSPQNAKPDLNSHLSRVKKLIQTRDAAMGKCSDINENNSDGEPQMVVINQQQFVGPVPAMKKNNNSCMQRSPQQMMQKKHLKRSITSISQEQLSQIDKASQIFNENPGLEKRLGKLRIVKSIHTRGLLSEERSITNNGDETSDFVNSGPLANELLQPMQYFSRQQKRSFVPNTSKLVLEGKEKLRMTRSRQRKHILGHNYKVLAREFGCQTTANLPPSQYRNSQISEKDRDLPSTQKQSNSMYNDGTQHSQSPKHLQQQQQIQVPVPSKIMFRGSSIRSTDKLKEQTAQMSTQQQRNFKMSLLKTSQAQAKNKFLIREEHSVMSSDEFQNSQRTNLNSVAALTRSQDQRAAPSSSAAMHTAMRMKKRKKEKLKLHLSGQEQDLQQDVFSWQNLESSFATPANLHDTRSLLMSSPQAEGLSSRNQINNMRKTHLQGAFHDHNTKPVSNREKERNIIRQSKLNKTADFFFVPNSQRIEKNNNGAVGIEDITGKDRQSSFLRNDADNSVFEQQSSVIVESKASSSQQEQSENEKQKKQQNNAASSANSLFSPDSGNLKPDSIVSFQPDRNGNKNNTNSSAVETLCENSKHISSINQIQSEQILNEAIQIIEQQQRTSIKSPKTANAASVAALMLPSKLSGQQQQSIQNTLEQSRILIETRLLNQMAKDLDKLEHKTYSKHGMESQIIFNAKELDKMNLVKHPEWIKLTRELKGVLLTTLNDYNHQIIGQNYYVRNDIRKHQQTTTPSDGGRTSSRHHNHSQTAAVATVVGNNGSSQSRRGEFMSTCITRIKNLFDLETCLISESQNQLLQMKEENAQLQAKVDEMRQKNNRVVDARQTIEAIVQQYFAMGHDTDVKKGRLQQADDFLNSKSLAEIIETEGREPMIEDVGYSNTLSRLQEILMQMQLPQAINQGNKFQLEDLAFDPYFAQKLRRLFADRFSVVQKDSALRSLQMVFKDIQFFDVGIQADSDEIDADLIAEVAFYKKEMARLLQETNAMKHKMMANEKHMKANLKEKADAMAANQAVQKLLQDARQDVIKQGNLVAQFKQMHNKSNSQSQQQLLQISKLNNQLEKAKHADKLAESLIEKFQMSTERKNVVIQDQDIILAELEPFATVDIMDKINGVRAIKKKIDAKNNEIKKAMVDFRKRDYHIATQTQNLNRSQNKNKLSKDSQDGKNEDEEAQQERLDEKEEMLEYERSKNAGPNNQRRGTSKARNKSNLSEYNKVQEGKAKTQKIGIKNLEQSSDDEAPVSSKKRVTKRVSKKISSSSVKKRKGDSKGSLKKSGAKDALSADSSGDELNQNEKKKRQREVSFKNDVAGNYRNKLKIDFDKASAKMAAADNAEQDDVLYNEDQLEFYGLFMQSTIGDVNTERPGLDDPKGRAKWDAWKAKQGMNQDQSRAAYVSMFEQKQANGSPSRKLENPVSEPAEEEVKEDIKDHSSASSNKEENLESDEWDQSVCLSFEEKVEENLKEDSDSIVKSRTDRSSIKKTFPIGGAGGDDKSFKQNQQTARLSNDKFGEGEQTSPHVTDFTQSIIINAAQSDWKPVVNDVSVQTDTEEFFQYIFSFLGELERRINSGEVSIEDILAMGRKVLYDENQLPTEGTKRWDNQSPDKKQMYFSVNELKECLAKLKGLGQHGGDVFFAGIARTMVAKPFIPAIQQSFQLAKSHQYNNDTLQVQSDSENVQSNDYLHSLAEMQQRQMQEHQMLELQKLTRVQRSTGGGNGTARGPSSPTKAQKASVKVLSAVPTNSSPSKSQLNTLQEDFSPMKLTQNRR